MSVNAAQFNAIIGALIAFGGFMGYMKKKSIPSLVAGMGSGLAYVFTGHLIRSGNVSTGHNLAIVLSLTLGVVMARRAIKAQKLMPAGLVAILATSAFLFNAKRALDLQA
eukprot:m.13554 g.13554  ORF g.13554 m.13554 type:complete len:110 (+) comp7316_c0_seq1:154-483(+)